MKQSSYLIFGLFFFLLTACQKESEIRNFNPESVIDESLNRTATPDPFEIRLQWTSYITAIIFYHHSSIRDNVVSQLSGENDIAIDGLISMDLPAEVYDFNYFFWYYLNTYFHPGRPNGDVIIPPDLTGDDDITQEMLRGDVVSFVNEILNEQCVELYFPEGIITNDFIQVEFTSTAHPLSTLLKNYGYLRHTSENPDQSMSTKIKTVDLNYMNANDNIIVARPFRHAIDCHYPEYAGINFELFLSY